MKVPVEHTEYGELGDYLGRKVTLGIRPEDIYGRLFPASGISGEPVTATVRFTELTGAERFLYVQTIDGSRQFVARVDRRINPNVGDQVELLFDMRKARFFDRETEKAI